MNRVLTTLTLLAAVVATTLAPAPAAAVTPAPSATTYADPAGPDAPRWQRLADRRARIAWASHRLPVCKQEDSRNCKWRADRHGNGTGRSFVNLNGRVYYWHPDKVRSHLSRRDRIGWTADRLRDCPKKHARNCVWDELTRPTERGMSWVDLAGIDYLYVP